jgi:hypothetical protein
MRDVTYASLNFCKKSVPALLILFVFNFSPAQTKTVSGDPNAEPNLQTIFIKLERLRPKRAKEVYLGFANNNPGPYNEETQSFVNLISLILSNRGALEILTQGRVIISTDTLERNELIKQFINILDKSGLSLTDLATNESLSKKVVDLKVQLQNLDFSIRCGQAGSNMEAPTRVKLRNGIFMVVAKQLLSKAGKFKFDCQEKSLTVTDIPERAGLISKVALMLD